MLKIKTIIFKFTIILLSLCFLSTVSGCTAQKVNTDQIKFGLGQEPSTLDPNMMSDGYSFQVAANIFEGLLNITDDLTIEPLLAKDWKISDDGLIYTFYLEENVYFHNGEHFTASDVKFSFDRSIEGGYNSTGRSVIDYTTVINNFTVEVHLKYPYAPALELFASQYMRIVSEKAVEDCGNSFKYEPIDAGTGPYIYVSWISGDRIILKANDNYWRGKPQVSKIVFKFYNDSNTRAIAVEGGEIQYASVSAASYQTLVKAEGINVAVVPSMITNYLAFNCSVAPFDNAYVRQAVAYCFDNNNALLAGTGNEKSGTVTNQFIVQGSEFYCDELNDYAKDVEKAKALLTKAGYPEGFQTQIYTSNANTLKNIATFLQDALKEIGIEAEIVVLEQAALNETIRAGGCPVFLYNFNGFASDPDFCFYTQYYTDQTLNYAKCDNKELNSLLADARATIDTDQRKIIYDAVSKIVNEECYYIPLYNMNFLYGYDERLTGSFSSFSRIYAYDFRWNIEE